MASAFFLGGVQLSGAFPSLWKGRWVVVKFIYEGIRKIIFVRSCNDESLKQKRITLYFFITYLDCRLKVKRYSLNFPFETVLDRMLLNRFIKNIISDHFFASSTLARNPTEIPLTMLRRDESVSNWGLQSMRDSNLLQSLLSLVCWVCDIYLCCLLVSCVMDVSCCTGMFISAKTGFGRHQTSLWIPTISPTPLLKPPFVFRLLIIICSITRSEDNYVRKQLLLLVTCIPWVNCW